MKYEKEVYSKLFKENLGTSITTSESTFKIKLFLEKAENSLIIAKFHKDLVPKKEQPKKLYWNYWAITISYYSILYATKALIHTKGYEVTDHLSAQIALGHLFVPDKIEKEDLELLNQAHKIFEEEYITYFDDARRESHHARYSAIKSYDERRLNEIYENARKFILKVKLIINE
jgi:uncharacterized protein (UPF0332 family)